MFNKVNIGSPSLKANSNNNGRVNFGSVRISDRCSVFLFNLSFLDKLDIFQRTLGEEGLDFENSFSCQVIRDNEYIKSTKPLKSEKDKDDILIDEAARAFGFKHVKIINDNKNTLIKVLTTEEQKKANEKKANDNICIHQKSEGNKAKEAEKKMIIQKNIEAAREVLRK